MAQSTRSSVTGADAPLPLRDASRDAGAGAPPRAGLTTRDVALALARRPWTLVGVPLLVGLATAAILLATPNRYTASVAMVPESQGQAAISGQLASLAAMARMALPGGAGGQSPQFYVSVLQSRPIIYAVLERKYAVRGPRPTAVTGDSATLIELLEPTGKTPAEREWDAARRLTRRVAPAADVRTNIIRLAVELPSAELAADVANAYASELDRFNREVRQSQARARRRFVEERLTEATRDLASAEDAVRYFLTRNRQYQDAPTLLFEYNRLQRAVGVQQELYSDLRRQLDAARIAEVNDLAVVSTIEPAVPPQRKSGPPRTKYLLLAVAAAAAATAAAIVIAEHHQRIAPDLGPLLREVAARVRSRRARDAA